MKGFPSLAGAVLVFVLLAPDAPAQCYLWPPPAPDMRGPGYYSAYSGQVYGPHYNVYPPFPPFQGVIPLPRPSGMGTMGMGGPAYAHAMGPGGPGGNPTFPTHPYARSPRDFFMYDENAPVNPYRYGYSSGAAAFGVGFTAVGVGVGAVGVGVGAVGGGAAGVGGPRGGGAVDPLPPPP